MSALETWALILGVWANLMAWWIYLDGKAVRRES